MAHPDDLQHPNLVPFVDRARIECGMFAFRCPEQWGALEQTHDPKKRFCGTCQKDVHLVTNEADLREKAKAKLCVAVVMMEELPDPDLVTPQSDDHLMLVLGEIA